MKKKLCLFIAIIALLVPFMVRAAESNEGYNSMGLKDVFKDEDIEISDSNYKENDKQVVIYMFRGKGCGYCRAFLEFLNSRLEEDGKMFKLQAYEVWHDASNGELLDSVAKFTGKAAGGVPYIIIGEKVFAGYSEAWNDNIIAAIKEEYDKKIDERYDVFEEMDKASEGTGGNCSIKKKDMKMLTALIVVSAGAATIIILLVACCMYNNVQKRFNAIYDNLEMTRKLSNKEVKELDNEDKPKEKSGKKKK